ncbi:MAG: ISKra4 family transposase, partial [Planctomycetes bacterium]|nr:ISKra4 family transposase [Planctomycetota bacterium]
ASCGSITFYDGKGEALATRRYGRMPERKKMTLKSFLTKEVEYALKCNPELQLVKVADGARDNWAFLEEELPDGISVLDFYHAAEHLKKAFEAAYGVDSQNANTEPF